MLGAARYRLEGNFMAFFNLGDDKGWGDGEFDVHCDPPWVCRDSLCRK